MFDYVLSPLNLATRIIYYIYENQASEPAVKGDCRVGVRI